MLDEAFIKLFVPPSTAFQLYEADVKNELLEDAASEGAGTYQTRLQEMWDGLDAEEREEYEDAVETVTNNAEQYAIVISFLRVDIVLTMLTAIAIYLYPTLHPHWMYYARIKHSEA